MASSRFSASINTARLDSDELIISAMIENYRTKIRILERVIDRIEKSELEKSNQNEEIQL